MQGPGKCARAGLLAETGPLSSGVLLVGGVFERAAGAELDGLGGGDLNRLTGGRVAALAGGPLADRHGEEPGDADLLATARCAFEGGLKGTQDGVDRLLLQVS